MTTTYDAEFSTETIAAARYDAEFSTETIAEAWASSAPDGPDERNNDV